MISHILHSFIFFSAFYAFLMFFAYLYLYFRYKFHLLNKYFAFFFLSLGIYILGEYFLISAITFSHLVFWHKFQYMGLMFLIMTFPLAIQSYLQISFNRILLNILSYLTVIFLCLLFFTDFIISSIPHTYGGILFQTKEGILFPFFLLVVFTSIGYTYGMLLYNCIKRKYKCNILFNLSIGISIVCAVFDALRIYLPIAIKINATFAYSIIFLCFAFSFYLFSDFVRIYKNLELHENEINKLIFKSKKELIDVLQLIASTLDAKDKYTAGHSERVTQYSLLIANQLNLTMEEKEKLKMAGLLHDIGKIGVSEKILNKPGRLTEEEYDEVKKHPQIAVDILSNVHDFVKILAYVLYHHERPDGKGYPSGLQTTEIPLLARIISVADVYDALTSDRPYREAIPKPEALKILKDVSGTQLDAHLVDVFINGITHS